MSLRAIVQARTLQVTLSRVDASTFEMALERTYAAVAHDVWPKGCHDDEELVSVLCDQLEAHGRLTPDELSRFRLLRRDVKAQLVHRAVYGDGVDGSLD